MMNRIFTALLFLLPFVSSAHAVDSLITQVDSITSVWVSPTSIQQGYLLESTNEGKDWDTVRFNFKDGNNRTPFMLSFNLPSPIIVAGDSNWVLPGFDGTYNYAGALLISKDRGRSWDYVKLAPGISWLQMFGMHFSDAANGVLVNHAEVWNTEDGGYTWKKNSTINNRNKDIRHFRLFFFDELVGVIKEHHRRWYTQDGGKTWSEEIGEHLAPTEEVSLQHALLSMRLDVLKEGMSSVYIYDVSNHRKVENYLLSFQRLEAKSTYNKRLYSRITSFLSSEPTNVRIINKAEEPILELKNIQFKPGQIRVFSMDFENNKLELDDAATLKMNEMRQKLQSERPYELRLFGNNY